MDKSWIETVNCLLTKKEVDNNSTFNWNFIKLWRIENDIFSIDTLPFTETFEEELIKCDNGFSEGYQLCSEIYTTMLDTIAADPELMSDWYSFMIKKGWINYYYFKNLLRWFFTANNPVYVSDTGAENPSSRIVWRINSMDQLSFDRISYITDLIKDRKVIVSKNRFHDNKELIDELNWKFWTINNVINYYCSIISGEPVFTLSWELEQLSLDQLDNKYIGIADETCRLYKVIIDKLIDKDESIKKDYESQLEILEDDNTKCPYDIFSDQDEIGNVEYRIENLDEIKARLEAISYSCDLFEAPNIQDCFSVSIESGILNSVNWCEVTSISSIQVISQTGSIVYTWTDKALPFNLFHELPTLPAWTYIAVITPETWEKETLQFTIY